MTSAGHRAGRVMRGALAAASVGGLILVGACSTGGGEPEPGPNGDGTASHDYLPGLAAFPHIPTGVTSAPVVVLVPGGGWRSADPTGLAPLAQSLAERGVFAMPVVIRAADDGVVHPVPVQDVLCALADAVATARAEGLEPERLVLLGHSSGAHLSALAALAPEDDDPQCEDPAVTPDAVVGLAGPYDIRDFADAAAALFAGDADRAQWDQANPVLRAGLRPEVPFLLLHGDADDVVPPAFSTEFGSALRAGGHDTTVSVLPGEDHGSIYSAEVTAEPVLGWLDSLPEP
ncbi:MAG TPA: prolyl oligopeptidase family serine peptidase [Ornithinibacter sp.]|nr:prolyl oligopeptidase family serine peptidase [Ornithinibacter sp.]